MISNISGVKKIDLPINMISNLGDIKTARVSDNVVEGMKKYYEENTNLVSISKKKDYRDRITDLYHKLEKIKPIDNSINGVVYLNDYLEKGLTIEPGINDIKQIWTEYRLIYNEQNQEQTIDLRESYVLSNFDEIYEKLFKKINGVGEYVEELNRIKEKVNRSSSIIEEEKVSLEEEKTKFEQYKKEEEEKLANERERIKEQIKKIESLINIFDLKISDMLD